MQIVAILPDDNRASVTVRMLGQEDWRFHPFKNANPTFAAGVAGGLVLCASDAGDVALFDPETRTCRKQIHLGRERQKLQGLISRDGKRAFLYTADSLVAFDTATLETTAAAHGLLRRGNEVFDFVSDGTADGSLRIEPRPGLVEHEDGTLIGTFIEDAPDDPASLTVIYGIMVFDPVRRIATRHVVQADQQNERNNLRWFSPNGRYALRFHYGGVPHHDGRSSWRTADLFQRLLGRGDQSALPDCGLDGIERIGSAWSSGK